MTTVVICDDDPIVRDALGACVEREEDLVVAARTETAEHTLALLARTRADVVVMDLALPGLDGIEATRLIRALRPAPAVLVLTTFGTEEHVRRAIAAGAAGFLLKSTSGAALVAAIRAAATRAGTLITPALASRITLDSAPGADPDDPAPLPETGAGPDRPAPEPGAGPDGVLPGPDGGSDGPAARAITALNLTDREAEVLTLLCSAESNAGIAAALSLSESTVKSHVSSLMTKLGCASRLQVALRAFEQGLATPPRPAPEQALRPTVE